MKRLILLRRGVVILFLCLALPAFGACSTRTDAPAQGAKGESSGKKQKKGKSKKAVERAIAEREGQADEGATADSGYEPPVELGTLEDAAVTESSGIVASRRNAGLFWTHNDSGDGAFLYAFDARGRRRGVWRVAGAGARDWEDIAAGPGATPGRPYLYIGDTGDNRARRDEVVVYRVAEPVVGDADAASTRARPRTTDTAEAFRLRYPDASRDAEALLVHPASGDIYIVTKTMTANAFVYKASAPLDASRTTLLELVGEISIPGVLGGMITGGDIAPDGRRLVLCDYFNAYELRLPPDTDAKSFDRIWRQTPLRFNLGARKQGEAIAYALDGKSIFLTSEKRPIPLIEVKQRAK